MYKIITEGKSGYRNHPATKEFENNAFALWGRLFDIREEMLKRGYHPKPMPEINFYDATWPVKPWQTLDQQITRLKEKHCSCNLSLVK